MSTTAGSVVIASRFNGSLHTGQGGYSAGVFAALLAGPVAVDLRNGIPVDTPLAVEREAGGARVVHGDTLIAEVHPAQQLALDVPNVTAPEARAAADGYLGAGLALFERCYVCGRERPDAFGVFAGPVAGRDVVASPWTPPAWAADGGGTVLDEHVWAALDCPSYFASYGQDARVLSYLVRMRARIHGPVVAGTEHVVVAWPLSADGRKRLAGCAVLDAAGEVLATAEGLLVEVRST